MSSKGITWVILASVVVGLVGLPAITAGAATTCRARDVTQGAKASSDLQSVIDAANAGDTIRIVGVCSGRFIVGNDLSLLGNHTQRSVLDGAHLTTVLTVLPGSVVDVAHLVITNGRSTTGGGIYSAGNLRLDHVVVSHSVASGAGGGIYSGGTLRLTRSLIDRNGGSQGGGIASEGPLTIRHSVLRRNWADWGGGLWANSSTGYAGLASIKTTRIVGNSGGGICQQQGLIQVGTTLIAGNTAGGGGGVTVFSGRFDMIGSVRIVRNRAEYSGGVQNVGSGTVELTSTNYVVNNVGDYVGGIFNAGFLFVGGASRVSGNSTAHDGGGIYNNYTGSVTVLGSAVIGGNSAGLDGGGIFNNGDLHITNMAQVTRNSAGRSGGGILNFYRAVWMSDTAQISHNTADSDGDGVGDGGGVYSCGTLGGLTAGSNVLQNAPDDIVSVSSCPS